MGDDNERKKEQKELEQKIHLSENEYKRNLIEYKATVSKISQIKKNIEEIFSLVDNETAQEFRQMQAQQGLT